MKTTCRELSAERLVAASTQRALGTLREDGTRRRGGAEREFHLLILRPTRCAQTAERYRDPALADPDVGGGSIPSAVPIALATDR